MCQIGCVAIELLELLEGYWEVYGLITSQLTQNFLSSDPGCVDKAYQDFLYTIFNTAKNIFCKAKLVAELDMRVQTHLPKPFCGHHEKHPS